jgi:hypothetical protein
MGSFDKVKEQAVAAGTVVKDRADEHAAKNAAAKAAAKEEAAANEEAAKKEAAAREASVVMRCKSHIEGKNADVTIYPDRIDWDHQTAFTGRLSRLRSRSVR